MPIYKSIVTATNGQATEQVRLIEATNKAQAIQYAARKHIAVEIADAREMHRLAKEGVEIESADAE